MAVQSTVRDQSGRPLEHAVVYATATEARPSPPPGSPATSVIVENFAFTPAVLPVRIGTRVSFLNRDDIRHQIYSISPAKSFELATDRLSESREVVFEKPGVVNLGCTLHDRTIGHVYVLETPYFATTDADGRAELDGLPRGAYEVRVWHPEMKASAGAQRVTDSPSHRVDLNFTATVQRTRAPDGGPPAAAAPPQREP